MIRVVYVVDNLSFRGGERTFLQLIEGLDRTRYDMSVACSPGGVFVERLEELRIPVIPADMRRRRLDTVPKLARILRRQKPHIVHTQGRGDPFGRLAGFMAGAPAIISTVAMIAGRYDVDELWRKGLYKVIDFTTDRMVDRWIVVNRSSVDTLTGRHRISPARIAVIPNGIELSRYDATRTERGVWRKRLGVPEGATLIGGLGRLTAQKGFGDLLRAIASIDREDLWLTIGGDGELREDLETLAAAPGLEGRCSLPGFIQDVPGFLGDLDLFVLSSHSEGHPMVLLEAMAMGTPVVATDIPGVSDTLADGIDGRLVPVGDVGALAAAVDSACSDRDGVRRQGRAARAKIERDYTVERMVQRTDLLYGELLAQKGVLSS